jgi:phage tail sheath protein|nr:MAG TPA: tail protein [Caudoviricetes sp.]
MKGKKMAQTELELKDIMASIKVAFKQRVATLIQVGSKGAVLACRKNEDLTPETYRVTTYKSAVFELEDKDLETKIKQIFNGGTSKVILLEYADTFASVQDVIKTKLNWNWLCSFEADDQTTVSSYCKENQKFGLVYNVKADSKWVCSVNNPSAVLADGVTINESSEITGLDLIPIVVGVIAGCPYTKSISYKIFTELESVTLPETIEEGQITLYNEDEGVRVASPVNTLLSTDDENTEDMKSICIVEGMKRVEEDMIYAFRTGYKGKYKNDYNHQCLFLSAGEYYITQLEEMGIFDPGYDNTIDIDVETQRALWKAQGKDADSWDEQTVKETTYKNMFYPKLDVKFLDAIEGMEMTVEMF